MMARHAVQVVARIILVTAGPYHSVVLGTAITIVSEVPWPQCGLLSAISEQICVSSTARVSGVAGIPVLFALTPVSSWVPGSGSLTLRFPEPEAPEVRSVFWPDFRKTECISGHLRGGAHRVLINDAHTVSRWICFLLLRPHEISFLFSFRLSQKQMVNQNVCF